MYHMVVLVAPVGRSAILKWNLAFWANSDNLNVLSYGLLKNQHQEKLAAN